MQDIIFATKEILSNFLDNPKSPFSRPSTDERREVKQKALFLNNFISKQKLQVKRVISVQGGLGTYSNLLSIINNRYAEEKIN